MIVPREGTFIIILTYFFPPQRIPSHMDQDVASAPLVSVSLLSMAYRNLKVMVWRKDFPSKLWELLTSGVYSILIFDILGGCIHPRIIVK